MPFQSKTEPKQNVGSVRASQYGDGRTALTVAVGTALLITITAGLISPRVFAFAVPLTLLAITFGWSWDATGDKRVRPIHLITVTSEPSAALLAIAAFFTFAAASAVWAEAPLVTLEKSLVTAVFVVLTFVAVSAINFSEPERNRPLTEGLLIGFGLGLAYCFIEVASDQALKISVINALGLKQGQVEPERFFTWCEGRLVIVGIAALTRNMLPLVLLLPAAVVASIWTISRPWNWIFATMLVVAAGYAVAGADSQTAKLTLIVMGLTVVGSVISLVWIKRLLMVGWVGACLLVLPIGMAFKQVDVGSLPWMSERFESASPIVRMMILSEYSKHVLMRPVFGHGANMAYVVGPRLDMERAKNSEPETHIDLMRQHPHNVYMQVWFELGAIGAFLFACLGVFVLRGIAKTSGASQMVGYVTFAGVATALAPSYGMWQYWLIATISLTVFCTSLASSLPTRMSSETSLRSS